jgi:hypothetical protein
LRPSEKFQREVSDLLLQEWGVKLEEQEVPIRNAKKKFDFVSSADGGYVGDAKFLTYAGNASAEMSGISEYVWLLQNVNAVHKFMVFGGDQKIPERWLKRWRSLANDIEFYFFENEKLIRL